MSHAASAWAWKQDPGNSTSLLVLLKLADNANQDGETWYSIQRMADDCKISKRSFIRALNNLIDGNWVIKVRKGGSKNGEKRVTNKYKLNLARRSGIGQKPPTKTDQCQTDTSTASTGKADSENIPVTDLHQCQTDTSQDDRCQSVHGLVSDCPSTGDRMAPYPVSNHLKNLSGERAREVAPLAVRDNIQRIAESARTELESKVLKVQRMVEATGCPPTTTRTPEALQFIGGWLERGITPAVLREVVEWVREQPTDKISTDPNDLWAGLFDAMDSEVLQLIEIRHPDRVPQSLESHA